MDTHWIDKIEVARRQVIVGVRLFFENADIVVIHTIIAAAHQILTDLSEQKGLKSVIKNPGALDKLQLLRINYPYNFMKHADRDPERKINIEPLERFTSDFMLDAIVMLQGVAGLIPMEAKVYWCWFVSKYPEGFANLPEDSEIRRMQQHGLADWDFPKIRQFLTFADIVGDVEKAPQTDPKKS